MKYIVANWKMNMNSEDTLKWVRGFNNQSNETVVVAPSSLHLPLLKPFEKEANFVLSGQDVSEETKGAHTGELGASQMKDYCKYCIIGHSERNEELSTVIAKRDLCLQNGITPIACFVKPEDGQKLYKEGVILAWEDPKNISKEGEYKEKSIKDIEAGLKEIRYLVPEETVIIYGGSVNKENAGKIANVQNLDGVLVGNASLDPKHFEEIINKHIK